MLTNTIENNMKFCPETGPYAVQLMCCVSEETDDIHHNIWSRISTSAMRYALCQLCNCHRRLLLQVILSCTTYF